MSIFIRSPRTKYGLWIPRLEPGCESRVFEHFVFVADLTGGEQGHLWRPRLCLQEPVAIQHQARRDIAHAQAATDTCP
jgi:hypothetical protein